MDKQKGGGGGGMHVVVYKLVVLGDMYEKSGQISPLNWN